MNTNIILIILVCIGLGLGAWFMFGREEELESLPNIKDGFPELGNYGNGTPTKSWGDFAQGIKDYIVDPGGLTDKQEIYNKNVDLVRGFLKGHNVEMSGWAVKTFAIQINDYIKNGGKPYWEVPTGSF